MSRIGKRPITIPSGVEITVDNTLVTVKGPKGTLSQNIGTYSFFSFVIIKTLSSAIIYKN